MADGGPGGRFSRTLTGSRRRPPPIPTIGGGEPVHTLEDGADVDYTGTGVLLDTHASEVFCVTYVDGLLVSSALDGSIVVRDGETHRQFSEVKRPNPCAPRDAVFALAGANGRVYSMCWDGTLACWSLPDLNLLHSVCLHPRQRSSAHYGGFAVAIGGLGNALLATGGGDGDRRIVVWQCGASADEPPTPIAEVSEAHSCVNHLAFAPQGDLLASVGAEGEICMWLLPGLSSLSAPHVTPAPSFPLPAADALAAASPPAEPRARPALAGSCAPAATGSGALSARASPTPANHSQLRTAALRTAASTISPERERSGLAAPLWGCLPLRPYARVADVSNKHISFSPDGETLASCGADRSIRLWTVPALEVRIFREKAHRGDLRRIAYTPDGSTLATCAADGTIRLWGSASLAPMGVVDAAHVGTIFGLAFSPHDGGRTLTTCGADRCIKRWATQTLSMQGGLRQGALKQPCIGVGFGADGGALVTVEADLTITVWAVPTYAKLLEVRGEADGEARCASLSADGKRLAVLTGRRGQLQVWATELPELESDADSDSDSDPLTGPDGGGGRGGDGDGGAHARAARAPPAASARHMGTCGPHKARSHAVAFAPLVLPPLVREGMDKAAAIVRSRALSAATSPLRSPVRRPHGSLSMALVPRGRHKAADTGAAFATPGCCAAALDGVTHGSLPTPVCAAGGGARADAPPAQPAGDGSAAPSAAGPRPSAGAFAGRTLPALPAHVAAAAAASITAGGAQQQAPSKVIGNLRGPSRSNSRSVVFSAHGGGAGISGDGAGAASGDASFASARRPMERGMSGPLAPSADAHGGMRPAKTARDAPAGGAGGEGGDARTGGARWGGHDGGYDGGGYDGGGYDGGGYDGGGYDGGYDGGGYDGGGYDGGCSIPLLPCELATGSEDGSVRIWLLDESAAESASISPLSPALANGRTRGRAGVAAGHCVGGASSSGGASARERERRETVDGARDGPSRGSARLRLLCAKEEAHGGDYVSAVGYAHTGQTLATLSVFAQLKLWAVVRQYRRSGRGEAGSGRDGAAAAADGAAARAAGAHEHEERRQSSEARRAAAARAVVLGAAGGGGAYDGGGGSGGVGALFASMDEREAERDHARADDDSELLWPLSAKLVPLFTLATAHELTSGAQARASISFAPDGQSVATAVGMTLRVWHLAAGAAVELRKELQLAALGAVATYAPDGYELAIGDSSGGLRLLWTGHLPDAIATPFDRALRAIRMDDSEALSKVPAAFYGLRTLHRNETFGWSLLHHACARARPDAIDVILTQSPAVLFDALAPPFSHCRRLAGKHGQVVTAPVKLVRGSAQHQAWSSPDSRAGPVGASNAAGSAAGGGIGDGGGGDGDGGDGGGGGAEGGSVDGAESIVPSVLDLALQRRTSAHAKACVARILEALCRRLRDDPAVASTYLLSPSGEALLQQLIRVGAWHADLLAAALPALGLLHQPSGAVSVTLIGKSPLYCAWADVPLPFGLAEDARARSRHPHAHAHADVDGHSHADAELAVVTVRAVVAAWVRTWLRARARAADHPTGAGARTAVAVSAEADVDTDVVCAAPSGIERAERAERSPFSCARSSGEGARTLLSRLATDWQNARRSSGAGSSMAASEAPDTSPHPDARAERTSRPSRPSMPAIPVGELSAIETRGWAPPTPGPTPRCARTDAHSASGMARASLVVQTAAAASTEPTSRSAAPASPMRRRRRADGLAAMASALRSRSREAAVLAVTRFWVSRRHGLGADLLRAPNDNNRTEAALAATYTAAVVPLCGDFVAYLAALEQLNGRRTRPSLYDNATTIALVHALWAHGAGAVHVAMCLAYAGLLAVTALAALLPRGLPDYTLLCCFTPFMALEVGSAITAANAADYFASAYNWADWLNYALLAFVSVPQSEDASAEWVRCAFAALLVLMGFKVLFYLRAYTTLVATILQAFRDMGSFALIVLLILVSFSAASSALVAPSDDGARGYEGPPRSWLLPAANGAFLPQFALMFGTFDLAEFELDARTSPSSLARAALFYAFSCLVTIVLLNLLITILSNSYDLSSERRRAELMRMRAQLIIEYHRLLPALLKPKGRYVHVLASSAHLAETRGDFELGDVGASDDEWSNRLTALKTQIAAARRESASATERLDERVAKLAAQVEATNGTLQSVLASLQGIVASAKQAARADSAADAADDPVGARSRRRSLQASRQQSGASSPRARPQTHGSAAAAPDALPPSVRARAAPPAAAAVGPAAG